MNEITDINIEKTSEKEGAKESVINAFIALSEEAGLLKNNMQTLMLKYRKALKILAETQQKNTELEKELNLLQARECALIGHIKSNLTAYLEQNSKGNIDARLIN